MTPTNSTSPSPMAPLSASFESCDRRASASMTRSSTASWVTRWATSGVILALKYVTLEAIATCGTAGSTHTRAQAGPATRRASGGGGRASRAEPRTQLPRAGPTPTISVMVGVVPSESPATGWGLWVERSEDTGTQATSRDETAMAAGTRQPGIKNEDAPYIESRREARKATRAKRSAQANTRLARIAVLVQNSSVVGPRSNTANRATITPKTIRAPRPSGTVLGSGIMKRAKIRTSGDVGRVEDVPSAPPDEVLGGHAERHDADEDLDPVKAPPLSVQRAGRPQDEGRAVSGQEPARRPQEHVVLEEGHPELDQCAHGQADQDLRHRKPEAEHGLPQHLAGQEHRRDV